MSTSGKSEETAVDSTEGGLWRACALPRRSIATSLQRRRAAVADGINRGRNTRDRLRRHRRWPGAGDGRWRSRARRKCKTICGPGRYTLASEGRACTAEEPAERIWELADRHPLVSFEDALAEDDWAGWTAFTTALGDPLQIVGDDLFTTSIERLERGIARAPRTRRP